MHRQLFKIIDRHEKELTLGLFICTNRRTANENSSEILTKYTVAKIKRRVENSKVLRNDWVDYVC